MSDRNFFHKIGDFFTNYGLEFGRLCTTTIIAVISILLGKDFNKVWVWRDQRINEKNTQLTLSDNVKHVLDFVIEKTAPLSWDDFIKLVYSTYPIVTQPRYSTLNLVQLASLYKQSIETK